MTQDDKAAQNTSGVSGELAGAEEAWAKLREFMSADPPPKSWIVVLELGDGGAAMVSFGTEPADCAAMFAGAMHGLTPQIGADAMLEVLAKLEAMVRREAGKGIT